MTLHSIPTYENKRLEIKSTGVAEASHAAPQLKFVLDQRPGEYELSGGDDTEIPAQRHHYRSAEPILRDNWQRLEPLRRAILIVDIVHHHHDGVVVVVVVRFTLYS